ncbi:hypothetical protein DN402_27020 [Streptomyces sp. SW4]|nr:hypothetical protein DN402_27020 [Streptomyces sp. SW4]
MAAPTHTRPRPATRGRAEMRLPWWALALPALAFVTLLALVLDPSEAHAAADDPVITRFLERLWQLVTR